MIDPETLTDEERDLMALVAAEIPKVENWADWANLSAVFGGDDCG